jgi:epoxide hydrolase-like predicted phosphatase
MKRIEFIYFDLGNVLISFDHTRAWQQIAGLTGIPPERVEKILFNSGLQIQYETGEISTKEFHRYFCQQAQVSISLENLCFAASNIFEPLDDSIQLLQTLGQKGHRLGLLSNTCDCHWQFFRDDVRFNFLHSSFEQTVLSFVAGCMKPDTDIYRIAARQANCDPESILFIDDLEVNVKAAQSYGFDGIHFQGFSGLLNELTKRELVQ